MVAEVAIFGVEKAHDDNICDRTVLISRVSKRTRQWTAVPETYTLGKNRKTISAHPIQISTETRVWFPVFDPPNKRCRFAFAWVRVGGSRDFKKATHRSSREQGSAASQRFGSNR